MLYSKVINRVVGQIHARAIKPAAVRCVAMSATGTRRVAVVGGGVSGLHCAHVLSTQGHDVTVFDMGKFAPGGRLTTRRTTWKGLQFDHGLQFVRPVTDTFKAICEEWLAAGALAPWEQDAVVRYDASSGKVTPRTQWQQQQQQGAASDVGFLDVLGPGPLYVGHPSSDAITSHIAAASGATVRNDVKVAKAAYDPSTQKWLLEGAVRSPARTLQDVKQQPPVTPWNLGVYDGLVLADKMTGCSGTPGFVELSGTTAGQKMQQAMSEVGSTPLLALLLAYQPQELPLEQLAAAAAAGQDEQRQQQQQQLAKQVLNLPFDAAAVANSQEISWICIDSSKPGRARADGIQALVALATPEFAATLVQRAPDGSLPPQTPELLAKMVPPMFGALQRVLAPLLPDGKLQEPGFVQVHRWGAAFPAKPFGSPCLKADTARLAACGDFCLGGGIENAVMSGQAAAEAMSEMLAAGNSARL